MAITSRAWRRFDARLELCKEEELCWNMISPDAKLMTYLKSPGRQSRDFMHKEPEPGQRQQNKPFKLSMNFTHHLRDVNVQIFALNKDVSNLTIYYYSRRLFVLPLGSRQTACLLRQCSAFSRDWAQMEKHTDCFTAAHIVMQSMLLLPHLLFHCHFWRINHLSRDSCFWFCLLILHHSCT